MQTDTASTQHCTEKLWNTDATQVTKLLLHWLAAGQPFCISLWVLCRYEKLTARQSNASAANTGTAAVAITATAGTAAAAAGPSSGQQASAPLATPQETADHSIHAICRSDLLYVAA